MIGTWMVSVKLWGNLSFPRNAGLMIFGSSPWESNLRKMTFLLNIDNYAPKITSLTYPLIHRYANKIGAEVFIISERKFPVWPLDYEKLQIFELAKQLGADWNKIGRASCRERG